MIKIKRFSMIIIAQAILCGCSSSTDEGVEKFVQEVKKMNGGYAEKSSDIAVVQPIKFDASTLSDPFQLLIIAKKDSHAKYPLGGRTREALEEFSIESITMVGTLEREGLFYALLRDTGGTVHITKIGSYVGENSGRIEKISDTEVIVKEYTPDGKGGWRDQYQTLHLVSAPADKGQGGAGKGSTGKGKATGDKKTPAAGTKGGGRSGGGGGKGGGGARSGGGGKGGSGRG